MNSYLGIPDISAPPELSREPLYEQVYSRIQAAIAAGKYPPGVRLNVQTIADDLNISRTPVREAMRQLVQEGLLEMDAGRRVRVCRPTAERIAEIYLIRAGLESTAVDVFVHSSTSGGLDALTAAYVESAEALEKGDVATVTKCNTEFHIELLKLSQSEIALRLFTTLHAQITQYRRMSMQMTERRIATVRAHGELLQLLQERDSGSRDFVYHHLLDSGRFAVEALRGEERTGTRATRYLEGLNGQKGGVDGLPG